MALLLSVLRLELALPAEISLSLFSQLVFMYNYIILPKISLSFVCSFTKYKFQNVLNKKNAGFGFQLKPKPIVPYTAVAPERRPDTLPCCITCSWYILSCRMSYRSVRIGFCPRRNRISCPIGIHRMSLTGTSILRATMLAVS